MAAHPRTCDHRGVTTTSAPHARGQVPPVAEGGDPYRPPSFTRRSEGRLVGGVASGLAVHLGLQPLSVRLGFALLAGLGGFGVVLYLALWIFTPLDRPGNRTAEEELPAGIAAATRSGKRRRRLRAPRSGDLGQLAALALLGGGIALLLQQTPLGVSPALFVPLLLAGLGVALIWRTADERQRRSMTALSPRAPWLAPLLRKGGLMAVARIVAGVVVIVAGLVAFLVGQDQLEATGDALLGVLVVVVGLALILGPWLWRLWRDLESERRERIVSQERADVAAHLHDSVLQTLALIQKHAHEPREVVKLARSQERDLRGWLYDDVADDPSSFAAALKKAAAEIEDAHGVPVDVVTVGDTAIDDRIRAVLKAAREAAVNAAKHSGADKVDIFAEVEADEVELFVRDRGGGFDPTSVPDDRLGVRRSIVGRMERHGGSAEIRSKPGEGTEVRLSTRRPR
jgi:signal transduction histidine kinase/phage shock protein PspC (stress-responsive transcriptional regulator)